MGLDIRTPIGLLFALLGALLTAYGLYGLAGGAAIYERSLGVNVNLWWGLVLLEFGVAMFLAGRRHAPARPPEAPEPPMPGEAAPAPAGPDAHGIVAPPYGVVPPPGPADQL